MFARALLVGLGCALASGATLAAGPARAGGAAGTTYTTLIFPGATPVRPYTPRAPLSDQDKADMQVKPLMADGAPPTVTAGRVVKGAAFFQVGVRHGLTGVLTAPVTGKGWIFSDRPLPIGQPVYGIPMSGSNGVGVVWCAPRQVPTPGAAPHWTAVCLPQNQGVFAWVTAEPALMTLDIDWPDGGVHRASAPAVARGPDGFPPMTLSYAFGGWTRQKWLLLEVRIDWGEGPQRLRTISVPPAEDGSVDLKLMGGEMVVRPAPGARDQALVEARTPPREDAPIAY